MASIKYFSVDIGQVASGDAGKTNELKPGRFPQELPFYLSGNFRFIDHRPLKINIIVCISSTTVHVPNENLYIE